MSRDERDWKQFEKSINKGLARYQGQAHPRKISRVEMLTIVKRMTCAMASAMEPLSALGGLEVWFDWMAEVLMVRRGFQVMADYSNYWEGRRHTEEFKVFEATAHRWLSSKGGAAAAVEVLDHGMTPVGLKAA